MQHLSLLQKCRSENIDGKITIEDYGGQNQVNESMACIEVAIKSDCVYC